MNKKSSSVLMVIFEILVVILVISMTFTIASSYGRSETIQKIFFAEDLRMMVNLLVANPGDSLVEYPQNVSGFVFVLDSEKVTVFLKEEEKQEVLKVQRKFNLPEGYSASGVVQGVERLCLEKKKKSMVIKECPKP